MHFRCVETKSDIFEMDRSGEALFVASLKELKISQYWATKKPELPELTHEYFAGEMQRRAKFINEFRDVLNGVFDELEKAVICEQVVPYHGFVSHKLNDLKNALEKRVVLLGAQALPEPCYCTVVKADTARFGRDLRGLTIIRELKAYAQRLNKPRSYVKAVGHASEIQEYVTRNPDWTLNSLAQTCLELENGGDFSKLFNYACETFITQDMISKFFPIVDTGVRERQLARVKIRVFVTDDKLYPAEFGERTLGNLTVNRIGWPYTRAMELFEELQFEINPMIMIKKFVEATTEIHRVICSFVGTDNFNTDHYFEVLLSCFAAARLVGRMHFLEYMLKFTEKPIGDIDYDYQRRTFQSLNDILTSEKDVTRLFQESL